MAGLGTNSRRKATLRATDRLTGCENLIDTGAEVSVFPASKDDRHVDSNSQMLPMDLESVLGVQNLLTCVSVIENIDNLKQPSGGFEGTPYD